MGAVRKAVVASRPTDRSAMSRRDRFVEELTDLIKARFPIIQVATFEEERALTEIEKIARGLDHKLMIWSASRGVYHLPLEDDAKAETSNKFSQADLAVALELLEVAASEFNCQGLELDYALVGWSWDLVWIDQTWRARRLNKSKASWQNLKLEIGRAHV